MNKIIIATILLACIMSSTVLAATFNVVVKDNFNIRDAIEKSYWRPPSLQIQWRVWWETGRIFNPFSGTFVCMPFRRCC